MEFSQQGDLLAFKAESIPKSANKLEHKIAADGLQRHLVENGDVFDDAGKRFVAANGGCFIGHPEHKPLVLDIGFYEIRRVIEYDHLLEESRIVID
jgi:hypothetical protein